MIMGVPYDAEVEYLESAGNQFINTGTKALNVTGFDMTFTPLTSLAPAYQAYLSTPSNTDFVIGRLNTAGTGTCYFRYDASKTLFINTDELSLVNPNRMYIDQERKWIVNSTDYGTVNADILGTVDEDMIFGGARSNYERTGAIRLYCIKLYGLNGTLVRDLIPVRVGQVGYMYDRVSKKLFGNQGTGSFVLGPDVAKPVMGIWRYRDIYSASDYIRDGLIAMWDGIENAGWGTHDPNATTWKELVGGTSTSIGSGTVFAQDYVSVPSTSKSIYDTKDLINSGSFTFEACGFCGTYVSLCTFGLQNYFSPYFAWGQAVYLTIDDGFGLNTVRGTGGANIRSSCAVTSHGGSTTIWFPKLGAQKTEIFSFGNQTQGQFYFTGQSGGICAIRLYNRALTADEIAYNYSIDKVRFNLP